MYLRSPCLIHHVHDSHVLSHASSSGSAVLSDVRCTQCHCKSLSDRPAYNSADNMTYFLHQAPDFNTWKPHDVKSNISQYPVTQLAWNVDGQRLATCGNERSVRLWRPEETVSDQIIPKPSVRKLKQSHREDISTEMYFDWDRAQVQRNFSGMEYQAS